MMVLQLYGKKLDRLRVQVTDLPGSLDGNELLTSYEHERAHLLSVRLS